MNYGGAERQILNLTRCLIEIADIDITLGLYRATGKLLSELDQIPQVEVIDLGFNTNHIVNSQAYRLPKFFGCAQSAHWPEHIVRSSFPFDAH